MSLGQQAVLASADRERQVFVTLSLVFSLLGASVGFGLVGTPVRDSAGGVFAADATFIAPAPPAFVIWRVIWLGLGAYTVWQWWPGQAASERQRIGGWLAGWSMILAGAWLLVTQRGWLWLSALFLIGIAVVLGVLLKRLGRGPAERGAAWESLVFDGTFGVYLGWACVATCANVAVALQSAHITFGEPGDRAVAAAVLAAASLLGVYVATRTGGRWASGLGFAWGLGWIAWGRLAGEPRSVVVAGAAAVGAAAVLGATAAEWRARRTGTG